MKTIYIYVTDTMADWELSFIMPAINQEAFYNQGKQCYQLKTVGETKAEIKTAGGLTIIPDCALSEIKAGVALILPGADTWADLKHRRVLELARTYLEEDKLVAGICGATLGLANQGLLNHRQHTSSALEFLTEYSDNYEGSLLYDQELVVNDHRLITAGPAGYLEFSREIMIELELFPLPMIMACYNYYRTGKAAYYLELLALSTNH